MQVRNVTRQVEGESEAEGSQTRSTRSRSSSKNPSTNPPSSRGTSPVGSQNENADDQYVHYIPPPGRGRGGRVKPKVCIHKDESRFTI